MTSSTPVPDTTPHRAVVVLSRALDQAGDVLEAVHPDDLGRPTPCEDWDVAHLVAHLLADPVNLLAMGRGEDVDWSAEPPLVEEGWAPEFRNRADDLIHHWHQVDDEHAGAADFNTAEIATHTWDLARAVGYEGDLDPEVAERGLAFMNATMKPEMRGGAFAPEREAPADADAYARLAAFAGREVG
jgi:uncharacterized protein (TIGR03086 family)